MKPLTLYMRNFKSYGEDTPIFDFNSFDIALLTGDNGNGKSSIADAISWCIWGQCKGMIGRSGMDDLVRTGADEMEVAFNFEEDSNIYRIIRKRDRGRGQSSLDLYLQTGDEFIPISGNSITETQSKILTIIKLDYETYLCTAYLSQGKADMFAMKRPNERKEILAEILNLSHYDRLVELAQERRRSLQGDIEMVEREIRGLEAKIEDEDVAMEALGEIENKLESEKKREQTIQEKLDSALELYREKSGILKSLDGYRANLKRVRAEIQGFKSEERELTASVESYRKLIIEKDKILAAHNRARELKAEDGLYRERLQIRTNLLREIESVENKINLARRDIEHDIKLLQQQIAVEEKRISKERELLVEQGLVTRELEDLKGLERDIGAMETQLDTTTTELAKLRAGRDTLKVQIEELRERYRDISGAQAHCPTCHTPLTDKGKADLLGEMEDRGLDLGKRLRDVERDIENLDSRQDELRRDIGSGREKLKQVGKRESAKVIVQRELKEIDSSKAKLVELTPKLEELTERIGEGAYAFEFSKVHRELKERLEENPYDETDHRKVQRELKGLEKIEEEVQRVQLADIKLKSYEEGLIKTRELLDERLVYEAELQGELSKSKDLAGEIDRLRGDIEALEGEKRALIHNIRLLQSDKGALDERLRQIRDSKVELKEKRKSLTELNEQLLIYRELINIYGKRGIQAAIIENAIPELQDETNRVLNKITDGQLTVEFLTQRDTKAGNTVETLDIKISDGLDTRKYETYSGGEEFRINFGIRIALAKILARRAGATVRMLVLDEGFGTLDEQGRERLAQVINAISDEFEKIIVITHIQDLKEYFSNQIEVYMTPNGSMFKLL